MFNFMSARTYDITKSGDVLELVSDILDKYAANNVHVTPDEMKQIDRVYNQLHNIISPISERENNV